jgi:hypothetical protein
MGNANKYAIPAVANARAMLLPLPVVHQYSFRNANPM